MTIISSNQHGLKNLLDLTLSHKPTCHGLVTTATQLQTWQQLLLDDLPPVWAAIDQHLEQDIKQQQLEWCQQQGYPTFSWGNSPGQPGGFSGALKLDSFNMLNADEKTCIAMASAAIRARLAPAGSALLAWSGFYLIKIYAAVSVLDCRVEQTICRPYAKGVQ